MFTLKLLGRLALADSKGPVTGQITQRRRLAFLAILGASPRATVTRDRLVALLWPELDAEGARHRLSDSLYVARRALGDGAIVTEGDDLRLSEEHVEVDTRAFERALDAGETALAIAQYGGPLLDGFHLGGEGEFDRWMEQERGRIAGRYAQALRTIAAAADRNGDHVAAGEYLQRLAALDPLDSKVVLQLMKALERAGNGATALRHARMHQTLRQTELGLGEDPSVRAAEDALVTRLDRATARAAAAEPVAEVSAIASGIAVAEPDREPLLTEVPATPTLKGTGSRRTSVLVGAGAVAATILTFAVVGSRPAVARSDSPPVSGRDSGTASVAPGVAVFPFIVRGSDSSAFSGDALAALIATELDGGAGLRSIDPNALQARFRPGTEHPDPVDAARVARSLGARYFVLGDAMQISGRLYLGAAMYDATDGKPVDARIGVQGASAGLFDLVDSLVFRLLVDRQGQPAPQFEQLASLTTRSLPALKLFIEGESFSRAGQYKEAAERYEGATVADSTFALGYYRLAWANNWTGRGLDQAMLQRATRYGARLPERIRFTLAALQAVGRGDFERGVGMLAEVIDRHPDDFDANFWLGDLLFHGNPAHGRSILEARGPLERASVLAPARSAEALFHLIEFAAYEQRLRDVDSLSALYLALDHQSDLAPVIRTTLAVTHRDSSRLALARRELRGMSVSAALRVADIVSAAVVGRATHAAIANLLASLDTPRAAHDRAALFVVRAQLAGADGDWRASDSLFGRAAAASVEDVAFGKGWFLSKTSLDPPPAMLRAALSDLRAPALTTGAAPRWAEPFAAMLALRLGDTVPAAIALPRAVASGKSDNFVRDLAVELSARRLLALGKPDEALAVLVAPGSLPNAPLRYLRGEVLESLHRPTEALAWYDVSGQDYDSGWYLPAIARAHTRLDRH